MTTLARQHDCLLLDLDGTVFRGHSPTEGALESLAGLDARLLYVTNNASRAPEQVAEHLQANGPYLLGENRSAADFVLSMLMRWSRNMPRPSDDWPALHAHALLMKALPSFKEVYAREGLTDWS